jgi:hypothetical protein
MPVKARIVGGNGMSVMKITATNDWCVLDFFLAACRLTKASFIACYIMVISVRPKDVIFICHTPIALSSGTALSIGQHVIPPYGKVRIGLVGVWKSARHLKIMFTSAGAKVLNENVRIHHADL